MIEILVPITMGKIRLTDFRQATTDQQIRAAQLSSFHLQQTVLKERPEQRLCLNLSEAKAGVDPSLDVIKWVVEHGDETIGAWGVYNIRTLSDESLLREIEGTPLPGVGQTIAMPQRELWARIMRHLLSNPLDTENRKKVDLLAWTFPPERGLRWAVGGRVKRPDAYAIQHLIDDGSQIERETDLGELYPVRLSRKGPP